MKATIPAQIGDTKCSIETEVVDIDLPLLLSKDSLKRAKAVLDMCNNKATYYVSSTSGVELHINRALLH